MTEYSENTTVYLLMTGDKKFVGFIDFASDRRFNFGFTSIEKAKEFIRMGHKNNKVGHSEFILYRCTLEEYFKSQEKNPKLPAVTIDLKPEDFFTYPLIIGDTLQKNIRVLKLDKPTHSIYSILTTPKE